MAEDDRKGWVKIPAALAWDLPGELLALYARIRYRDRGTGCWSGLADLQADLSERQTRRNLRELEKRGLIVVEARPGAKAIIRCPPRTPMSATPDTHIRPDRTPMSGVTSNNPGHPCPPPRTLVSQTPDTHVRHPGHPCPHIDEVDPRSRSRSRSMKIDGGAGAPPVTPEPLVLEPPAQPKRKKVPKAASGESAGSLAWDAYATAYERRYGAAPVRNAKVNAQLAQVVARLGATEAPAVAAYFVEHISAYYASKGHPVSLLLADAEKLRTEWATGRQINATSARREEQSAANPFAQMLEARRRAR